MCLVIYSVYVFYNRVQELIQKNKRMLHLPIMFCAYSGGYRNHGHVGDTVIEACVAKMPTVCIQ